MCSTISQPTQLDQCFLRIDETLELIQGLEILIVNLGLHLFNKLKISVIEQVSACPPLPNHYFNC
jgi:hypothetical protein